jgi:hypothetical protein
VQSLLKSILLSLLFFYSSSAFSQPWLPQQDEQSKPLSFFDIQKSFNEYWKDREIEKGKGWKQFKRWEHYWEKRVDKFGNFPPSGIILEEIQKYKKSHKKTGNRVLTANWTSSGPSTSSGGYAGIGRINSVSFHPSNTDIIYAGAAGGGLWKTINGGTSWFTNTDDLAVLGVSGIVVHPTNPNIVYIATGDGDGGDNYSVGVMKSEDGGATFTNTGLNWSVTSGWLIRRMIIDPDNSEALLVATSNGIYRTVNAGIDWVQEQSGNFYDIEAKTTGSSNTFYASSGANVYRSTNNGDTWTSIYSVSNSNRLSIATTAANADYVYVLSSSASSNGFNGVYRSTNSGNSFAQMSNTPNLLGWSSTGSDGGGQGWYDLAFTADPANAETVYVGGVNTWKSTNGGTSWSIKSHWAGAPGVQTVHADKHVMEWQNSVLWEGNDGGLYKSGNGGNTWNHMSNGMVISQMYKLGVSQTDTKVIAGLQDNGTKLMDNNGNWTDEIGGDGMECAINSANSNIMYGSLYFGEINRSTNGGSSWTDIQNNITGQPEGAWVTPYVLDPTTPTTIYAGFENVYKSTNQGNDWTTIGSGIGAYNKELLRVSKSNSNYIYTGRYNNIRKTTNGGTSWTSLNPPGANLAMIEIHPTDPEIIWAVLQNYSSGQKVYKSINGGTTWTNISGTLPNLPVNCIIYQEDTPDGLYIGMDAGIFYKDDTMSDWELFSDGLPNVEITELDINYNNNSIYASTYGRGIWKSELVDNLPSCFPPVNVNVSELTTSSAKLAWSNPTVPPSSYEYAITLNPQAPQNGNAISAPPYIATNLQSATFYYFHVRSVCGFNDYSNWVTVGPIKTLPKCDDNFYDSGDINENYDDNEDITVTICPENPAFAIQLEFTEFNIETEWDALYIYDGNSTSSPQISSGNPQTQAGFPAGGYYGTTSPGIVTSSYSSGCLTVRFLSDASVTELGWSAKINCLAQCGFKVFNTNDRGIGSLRKEIECAVDGQDITFFPDVYGQTIFLTTGPIMIDKNINIHLTTGDEITLRTSNVGPIFDVLQGKQLSLKNMTIYGGNNANGSALINSGNLTLDNVIIYQSQGNPNLNSSILNQNTGTINVLNNTQVKKE